MQNNKKEANEQKERARRILKAFSDNQVKIKLKTIANMRTDILNHKLMMEKLQWTNSQIYAQIATKYNLQPMDEYILLEAIVNPKVLDELKEMINGKK